jgi:hypothetical protein
MITSMITSSIKMALAIIKNTKNLASIWNVNQGTHHAFHVRSVTLKLVNELTIQFDDFDLGLTTYRKTRHSTMLSRLRAMTT